VFGGSSTALSLGALGSARVAGGPASRQRSIGPHPKSIGPLALCSVALVCKVGVWAPTRFPGPLLAKDGGGKDHEVGHRMARRDDGILALLLRVPRWCVCALVSTGAYVLVAYVIPAILGRQHRLLGPPRPAAAEPGADGRGAPAGSSIRKPGSTPSSPCPGSGSRRRWPRLIDAGVRCLRDGRRWP
jgi:hypothetical protein